MGSAADEAAARGEAARPAGDMAPPTAGELGAEQRRAADAGARGTILLSGPAGTGKTEAAARRIAALGGTPVLALAANRASARRLRERVDQLRAEQPGEETWIGTWESIGERLLREQATAAGVDPFFDVLGPAERLAILLDRVEELPLRLHEIRGNPSSLLARLLRRIDSLKADAIGPEELAEQARAMRAGATDPATRESADREQEFAELYAAHDRILAEHGSLDRGDLTLACLRLARERPDLRAELAGRFPHLVVEEIEELDAAQWALLTELAAGCESLLATYDEDHDREGRDASARFTAICPGATRLTLEQTHRGGARVRFWRCANRRAQAQATAREIESLIAGGAEPESICVFVGRPARDGLAVGAALEERSIPFRLTDPAALFRRPEVRDTIAWLRLLADPGDSPAAARALTRPPVQLRSADLARLTTIARRRKLNLVAACAAALESPQFQPEARDRLREFLKLYEAASKAMEDRRADVFVRRLIERVGLRRQRMFAAQAEVAERLISLSRLAEVATAWSRREPQGTTRDFIRYVSAIADAGLEMGTTGEVPRPGTVAVIALDEARGLEFAHVFAIGLDAGGDAAGASGAAAGGGDSSPADRSLAAAMTRARESLVLAWPQGDDGQAR
ncbi:MAG TPA: ATP-dependent helicase, partial [Solirubrobacterales bacterium]|nr:ATP-dependent helicase [Solirubrobacterales bacterium]